VLGPLVASAILLAAPGRYRLVFGLAAIPALISVLIVWLRVQERTVARKVEASVRFEGLRGLPRSFRLFLLVIVLFTLGNATDAFLLLRAQQLGVELAWIPALWAMLHVSKMASSVPGGLLADRAGPRIAIISGWLLYAAVYCGFAFATAAWQVWLLLATYGLFYGLTEAPERALVAALAPRERRGAAFGAYHFAIGVAALPASVIFGLLWQHFSSAFALLTGATIALTATLLFLFADVGHSIPQVKAENGTTGNAPDR
jgi:MFS family permease